MRQCPSRIFIFETLTDTPEAKKNRPSYFFQTARMAPERAAPTSFLPVSTPIASHDGLHELQHLLQHHHCPDRLTIESRHVLGSFPQKSSLFHFLLFFGVPSHRAY